MKTPRRLLPALLFPAALFALGLADGFAQTPPAEAGFVSIFDGKIGIFG